jgi:hypothetical protein
MSKAKKAYTALTSRLVAATTDAVVSGNAGEDVCLHVKTIRGFWDASHIL